LRSICTSEAAVFRQGVIDSFYHSILISVFSYFFNRIVQHNEAVFHGITVFGNPEPKSLFSSTIYKK